MRSSLDIDIRKRALLGDNASGKKVIEAQAEALFLYGMKRRQVSPTTVKRVGNYPTRSHHLNCKDSVTLVSYPSEQRPQLCVASPGNPLTGFCQSAYSNEWVGSGEEALLNVPTNDTEACGWGA